MQMNMRVQLDAEVWRQMFGQLREPMAEFSRNVRSAADSLAEAFRERALWVGGISDIARELEEYRPAPTRGFVQFFSPRRIGRQAIVDEIRWFEPEPFVVHAVEIPSNWRDLRPDIPLPEMPEPLDFTEWRHDANYQQLFNPFRRR